MANYGGSWGSMGSLGDIGAQAFGPGIQAFGSGDTEKEKQGFFQKMQDALAPGSPGAALLQQGAGAAASLIQQQQSSLAALRGRLAGKQARLKTAKREGVKARLRQQITQLLHQISALESALQGQGADVSAPAPTSNGIKKWLPFVGIGTILLAIFGGAFWFMRRKR